MREIRNAPMAMLTKQDREDHLFLKRFLKAIFLTMERVWERYRQPEKISPPKPDKMARARPDPAIKILPSRTDPVKRQDR